MAQIKNIEGLSINDVNQEISKGAKFVIFQYCFSIVILTSKRDSGVYFIKAGKSAFKYIIGFSLITLLFGWWGIPYGPIYSIEALYTNLTGGIDITQEVFNSINFES